MMTPDEIMELLDKAQMQLDETSPGMFDLTHLMWEIINDVMSSFGIALETYEDAKNEALNEVNDYLSNHYG